MVRVRSGFPASTSFILPFLFGLLLPSQGDAQGISAGKFKALKLLYVGVPASERGQEYFRFLSQVFGSVAKANRGELSSAQVKAADVVILDWYQADPKLPGDASPLGPRCKWNKPVVMLGSAGYLRSKQWSTLGGYG